MDINKRKVSIDNEFKEISIELCQKVSYLSLKLIIITVKELIDINSEIKTITNKITNI